MISPAARDFRSLRLSLRTGLWPVAVGCDGAACVDGGVCDMSEVNPFARVFDDQNPYAAPLTSDVAGAAMGTAEAVRREHIAHEASIRSIGFLYLLGGILGGLAGIVLLVTTLSGPAADPESALIGVFLLGLCVLQGAVGVGLRKLQGWTRIPVGLFSGIGLLGFPVGTLINGYILYLVFSSKARTIFSAEYKAIVQQTPHIRQQTSWIVWLFLLLLLGVLGMALLLAFIG